MVNFVPAVAYHFCCLALPAVFTHSGECRLAEPCRFPVQINIATAFSNLKSKISIERIPVGQHHRVARRAGEGEEVVAGSAAGLDFLLVLFHVPLLHRLSNVIFFLLPCQFLHPAILVQIVVQFPLVRGVYVGLASGIIGRG